MKKRVFFFIFILRFNRFIISDSLKRFFSLNKALIFCISLVLSLGLITGILCVIKSDSPIKLQTMPYFLLKKVLSKEKSFFFYFFIKSLITGLIFAACFIFSFLKIGPFLVCGTLFYMGYLLGISCAILFYCVKLSLLLIIVVVPCEILVLFLLSICSFRFLKFNKQLSKYGNCYIRGNEIKILMLCFIICIAIILIQTLLLILLFKICVII